MSDSKYCDDCGDRKMNGICTNCHEELYINDFQMPDVDEPIAASDEWAEKVSQQREEVRRKNEPA